MDWNKFINFDELVMPVVIKVIYILGSIGIIISAIYVIINQSLIMGFLGLIGGLLGVRIYCELMIVLFKLSENVSKILDK